MATKRQRGKSWHYTIRRAGLLPKPINLSFADEDEGDRYCQQLESLLDRGIIPEAFQRRQSALETVRGAIVAYVSSMDVPRSDRLVLEVVGSRIGSQRMMEVNYAWAERWIESLKQSDRLAPSTIRHHVGALARCLDWVVRRHPDALPANPLRMLPRRYSSYSDQDAVAAGGARRDASRDRRLLAGEDAKIRSILEGAKPEGRQRPLELIYRPALVSLYDLALETAMRLSEIYTLDLAQIVMDQRTIFLDKTKNGDRRQVPLSSVAVASITRYLEAVVNRDPEMDGFSLGSGLIYPWWDGSPSERERVTALLSRQFGRIFAAAGCDGLRFHDIRHEATCRFYERTTLTDLQISTITGHKDPRMLKRYANLRGSDLAARLW